MPEAGSEHGEEPSDPRGWPAVRLQARGSIIGNGCHQGLRIDRARIPTTTRAEAQTTPRRLVARGRRRFEPNRDFIWAFPLPKGKTPILRPKVVNDAQRRGGKKAPRRLQRAATASAAGLARALSPASTRTVPAEEWPRSAKRNTIAAPAAHRNSLNRHHGKGSRLSAAAVTPLTMKATPAIAHQGPAVRNCMARGDNKFCHRFTKS